MSSVFRKSIVAAGAAALISSQAIASAAPVGPALDPLVSLSVLGSAQSHAALCAGTAAATAAAAAAAQGPVVLTAAAPAWLRVTDQGRTLFEGMLQPGQSFTVPPAATAPLLRVGAPEALRISVGNAVAPPVGPPGQVTSNVSLLPADLMSGGAGSSSPQPGAAQAPQNSLAQ